MSAHLKLLLYVDECVQKCDSKPERICNGYWWYILNETVMINGFLDINVSCPGSVRKLKKYIPSCCVLLL